MRREQLLTQPALKRTVPTTVSTISRSRKNIKWAGTIMGAMTIMAIMVTTVPTTTITTT